MSKSTLMHGTRMSGSLGSVAQSRASRKLSTGRHPKAKLSNELAAAIKFDLRAMTQAAIVKKYESEGVTSGIIQAIAEGRTYRSVQAEERK